MNLDEVCQLRSNALCRELAGCLAIDPLFVLPLLDRLKSEAFTDTQAKIFIEAVRENVPELQAANPDEQATIVVHIASENNLLSDYCSWIIMPKNLYRDAPSAIKELKSLAITQNTLAGLAEWIGDLEERNEWR